MAPLAGKSERARVRLRVTDLVALAIVGGCALDASSKLLPGPAPFLQSSLVIALTALAARRLLAWRHGASRALTVRSGSEVVAILVGMAPWFMLPLLHGSVQASSVGTATAFGISLPAIGACLVWSAVFSPFWRALFKPSPLVARVEPGSGSPVGRAGDDWAHAIGIVLLSSSPFLAVLAAGSLVMRRRWVRDYPAPQSSSVGELREAEAA